MHADPARAHTTALHSWAPRMVYSGAVPQSPRPAPGIQGASCCIPALPPQTSQVWDFSCTSLLWGSSSLPPSNRFCLFGFFVCVSVYPRMDCARKTFSWLQLICQCGFKLQMDLRYPRNLLLASEHEPPASGCGGYHAGEENGCSWGRSTCSQYKGCFTAQSCCGSGECGRAEQSRADKKASVLLGCASPMAFTALFTSGKQLQVQLSSV